MKKENQNGLNLVPGQHNWFIVWGFFAVSATFQPCNVGALREKYFLAKCVDLGTFSIDWKQYARNVLFDRFLHQFQPNGAKIILTTWDYSFTVKFKGHPFQQVEMFNAFWLLSTTIYIKHTSVKEIRIVFNRKSIKCWLYF